MKYEKIKCNEGQIFRENGSNENYLLSGFEIEDEKYGTLINQKTGNRFMEPIKVDCFVVSENTEIFKFIEEYSFEILEK